MASGWPGSACSRASSCSCWARRRSTAPAKRRAPLSKGKEFSLYGVGIAAVAVIWALVQYQDVIQTLLIISGIGLLGYVLFQAFKLEKEPRERIFAILFLIALNPIFWGLFEQAGGSMNLFTDRFVDRAGVPASIFQSINPIYIILLAPFFAGLWVMLGKRGLEPSAPAKFGIALLQMGFANLVLVWGALAVGINVMVPVLFVFLYYLFATTAELCLSPVGLSAMNRLAPSFMASLIMGAWFYMTAVGNFVAGKIGEATGGHDGEMTKQGLLDIYSLFGWVTIGIGVAVLLVSPLVKKWMHLDTLEDHKELAGRARAGRERRPPGSTSSARRRRDAAHDGTGRDPGNGGPRPCRVHATIQAGVDPDQRQPLSLDLCALIRRRRP